MNEEYDIAEFSPRLSHSTFHSFPSLTATAPGGLTLPSPPSFSATAPGGQTFPSPPSLSATAPGGQTIPSPPSLVDPFSLPLCHYFSQPLSVLTSLLQSAMTLPHASSPTLTSVGTPLPRTTQIFRQPPVVTLQPTVSRPPPTRPGPFTANTSWSSTLSPVYITLHLWSLWDQQYQSFHMR